MKRLSAVIICILLAVAVLSGVADARRIRGNGNVVHKNIEVSGIDGVELATIGTLYIEVGETEELVVEADENLIEVFDFDVHGGMLTIDKLDRFDIRDHEPIKYYLTVKQLEDIVVSSSGDIKAPDLEAERFSIEIGSSGNVNVGDLTATSLDVEVSSSGDVELANVTAQDVEIDINSSGDVGMESLNKARLLSVGISSSGNVEVWGGEVEELDISIGSSGDFNGRRLKAREAEVTLGSSGDATVWVTETIDARIGSSGDLFYVGDPEVDASTGSSGRVKRIR